MYQNTLRTFVDFKHFPEHYIIEGTVSKYTTIFSKEPIMPLHNPDYGGSYYNFVILQWKFNHRH